MIGDGPSILRLAKFINGYPFKPEQLGSEGLPVVRIRQLVDPRAEFDCAEPPPGAVFIVNGDLVFSWSGSLEVRLWDRGRALLNQHLFRVEPDSNVEIRWLRYVLEVATDRLEPLMHGSAMTHVTRDMLRIVRVSVPARSTQERVAHFLDAETDGLDRLVAQESQMLELLDERLDAGTSSLVTCGLRPPSTTQDSRIEPIGLVPGHWRVVRNKTFMHEITDLSPTGDEELLTVSHITGVTPRAEKDVNMFLAESFEGYKRVTPGDLVINTMWAWMGALGVSKHSGIVSPAYGVYRIDPLQADATYIDALFRSRPYVAQMTRYSRGVWTSRLRLYPEVFLSLSAPLPPLDEQRQIANRLLELRREHADITDRLERAIALLRERRQAVIAAAVTGELDVSVAA